MIIDESASEERPRTCSHGAQGAQQPSVSAIVVSNMQHVHVQLPTDSEGAQHVHHDFKLQLPTDSEAQRIC